MPDTLDYHVTAPNGQTDVIGDEQLRQHLTSQGFPVIGGSADGQTVTLQDEKGKPYDVDAKDALKHLGYQIHDVVPSAANFETLQPEWRAAVNSMGDDDHRKAYIESRMKRAGSPQAQVVGSGRNWFVFNPDTSQWLGVTNEPGHWGMGDLAEAATEAPRLVGALGGGALGAAGGAGLGSVALGAAGAGAGSALGQGIERYAMSKLDPSYAETMGGAEENAQDIGLNAGVDAAAYPLGLVAGKMAGPLLKAPLSSAARGIGAVTEGAGQLLGGAGKMAGKAFGAMNESPWLKGAWDALGPATTPDIAAGIAQTPEAIINGGAEGLKTLSQKLGENAPKWLTMAADQIGKTGEPVPPPLAEKLAAWLGGNAAPAAKSGGASQVMQNIGEMAGRGYAKLAKPSGDQLADSMLKDILAKNESPLSEEAIAGIKNSLLEHTAPAAEAAAEESGRRGGQLLRPIGRAAENLGTVGRGVDRAMTGVYRGGAGLTQGLGAAMSGVGGAMKAAGTVGQSIEAPTASMELLQHSGIKDWLRKNFLKGKMGAAPTDTLADN